MTHATPQTTHDDSELRTHIAQVMGYVDGMGADWYPDETEKIMTLLAEREREAKIEELTLFTDKRIKIAETFNRIADVRIAALKGR